MQDIDFEEKLTRVYQKHVSNFIELLSVERLSGGASQETYRITFKTPDSDLVHALRRSAGGEIAEITAEHPGLKTEALLMDAAKHANVPVPEIYYVLQEEDDLGAGFIMAWLEGETLGSRIVKSEKFQKLRTGLAAECGRLLARIHSIDLKNTALREHLTEVSPKEFVEQIWEKYQALDTPQPMIDYTARWLLDHLPENYEACLVHNDFRNGNLMVSEDEVVAVLDWELAHIGDPMRDLGWICVNSWRFGSDLPVGGFGDYEDLFKAYESESGQSINRDSVRFWEVFGSFWWSVGCLGMAEHYRNGPDQSVERPAVGRRSSECQIDCVNLLIPGKVVTLESPSHKSLPDGDQLPMSLELLESVIEFLRDDIVPSTEGRNQFLSRVSANSLAIVKRELQLGSLCRENETNRLQGMFDLENDSEDEVKKLRWRLTRSLRDGSQSLDDKALQNHLRQTVFDQISIDQPRYSGLKASKNYR